MTGYEKTLPSYWINSKLGEVCQTTSGGTPSRKNPSFYDGNIPWVKSGELNYNIILETEEHISEDAIKKSSAKIFSKGTLLVALYGATIGKLAILGIEAATNQAVCAIFKNGIFESKFLYYLLFHRRQDLIKEGIGGAQPNISQTILKNLEIPICPLPEQRAIISKIEQLFSELDNGIANLKLAQEQLKVYRQAVLKKAFGGELTKKWRKQQIDLPGAGDLLEQIRKEREETRKTSSKKQKHITLLTEEKLIELPQVPEKWKWVKIGEVLDVFVGSTPSRKEPKFWRGDIPWVSSGEVAFCRINSTKESITKLGLDNSSTQIHPIDTVMLGMIGEGKTRGQVAILNINACHNQNTAAIRINSNYLSEFVYYFFEKNYNENRRIGSGNNQQALNKNIIENMSIPLCSLPEQQVIVQEIETRLSVCDKIEQDIADNLVKAEALRQSILKKAFEGKLLNERELAEVRKAEDWEPAEVLLERIKAENAGNRNK
ncbi:MAG: restriction endonuclease subunit S [Methanosarcina sp.]